MKSFEHYITRVDEAAERGLVDYNIGDGSILNLLDKAIKAPGETAKLGFVLSALKQALPAKLSSALEKRLRTDYNEELPYNSLKLEFKRKVGHGGESRVFLLESRDENMPSFVIKINYVNKGNFEEIIELAKQSAKDYDEIKKIYEGVDGLIPDEFHIVIKNPKTKKPAVAIFQKFFSGKIKDIFELAPEEAAKIIASDENLKNKFNKFMEITLKKRETDGTIIDLAGQANLCLVDRNGKPDLVFLDPHNSSKKDFEEKEREEKIESCLNYLTEICELVAI